MLMSIVGGRVCSSCLRFSLLLLFLLAYVHVCYSVPPICVDLTGELDEDTDLTLNPFSVATDADGNIDVASTVLLTPPDRGTVTVNAHYATMEYTPDSDYNGPDSFTYKICDLAQECSDECTVMMAVSSVDDAPVASPLFLSMLEDAELFITLTTLTADVDTDTALNQDSGGLHTYSNAYGQALDVYIIDDVGEEGEDRGVLFQTSGVGGGGGLQQAEQINITRSFLESSSPPPSSFSTSSVLVSNPSSFSVLFKPAANAFSAEGEVYASFSFVVSDGRLNSSVAQVLISVTAVEDPPFFQPRTLRMLEDSSLTINPVSWAYDDPNEAGMDPNTLKLLSTPEGYSASVASPLLTITPDLHTANVTLQVAFLACDTGGLCANGSLSIIVEPIPHAPITPSPSYQHNGTEDMVMEIDLTSVIWDRDGDLKLSREQGRDGNSVSSISISGGGGNTLPKHGSISVDPSTFLITYTPDEHFVGADTCTYTVCDELRNCTKGRLDIGVAPVNDAHTLRAYAVTTLEDAEDSIILRSSTLIVHNAYESDADMSFFSLSPAQYYPVYTQSSSNSSSDSSIDDHASDDSIPTNNGRVTLVSREAAEAVIAYIPNPDFFGADIILYSVCDSTAAANVDDQNAIISNDTGWCVNGSISVTVIPVNDAPLAEISAQSVTEEESSIVRLSYTDVDEGEDGNASYTAFLTCLPPSHVVQLYFDAGADTGAGASITEADSLLNATENAACDCNSDGDGINDDDDEYTSVCVQIPLNKSMTLYAKTAKDLNNGDGARADAEYLFKFKFKVNDGELDSETDGVVSVLVLPVNDPPGIVTSTFYNESEEYNYGVSLAASSSLAFSVKEDQVAQLRILNSIFLFDVDNVERELFITIIQPPSTGSTSVKFATREIPQPDAPANAPPVYKNVSFIEYTPALNYVGGDSFSIIICDNNEDGLAALNAYASSLPSLSSTLASLSCTSAQTSEFVQVQLTVVNINDAPFSTPTSYIVQEDHHSIIGLSAYDEENDPVLYYIASLPSQGTLHQLKEEYYGDTADADVLTEVGTVHVDLDVDAPLASVTALLGPPLTEEDLPVLVNFTIVDTSSSSSSVFAQLVYTPKKDIVGTNIDSFTYFVSDTFSQSIPKAVTFDVVNINDAPTLPTLIWRPTEEYVVTEIDPRTFKEIKVRNLSPPIGWNVMTEHVSLVSDIDDNLDINSSSVYTQPPREHGNVTMLLLNSSFPYVFQWHNNGDFFGVTNFTYQVCDTLKVCSQGTVIVDVINVNDPPVLSLGQVRLKSNSGDQLIDIRPYIYDPDSNVDTNKPHPGTLVSYSGSNFVVKSPVYSGIFRYFSDFNFIGYDQFEYQVCDMDNECDTSVLYIIVDPLDGSMIHEAYDLVALANPSVGTVSSSSSSSSTGDDEDTVANEIDAGIGDGDGGASSSTADAYMVEEDKATMFSKIDESGYSDFIYSGAAVVIVLSLLLLGFCLIGREKRKKFTFLAKDFDLRKESNSSVVLQGTQAQNMNDGTVDLEHGASYDDDDTDESCSSTHDSHEAIFRSYGGSLKQGSCASTNAHNKGTNEGKGGERDTNFRVVKPAVANMTNFSVTGSNPNSSNIIHAMNLRGNAGAARGGRGTGGRPLRPLVASLALPSMSPSLSLMQTLNEGEVASVSLHMPAHSNKHTAKKLSSAHSSLFSINEQRKSSGAPAHERLDSSSKKSSIHRHLKSSILNYNIGGSKMDSERNIDERKTGASSPVFNTMSQERAQTGRESLLSTCEHDNILKMDELERQSFLSFKKELNQAEKQHLSLWIEYEKGRVARKKVLKKVLRKKAEIATLQVQAQGVLAREKKKKGVPNPKEEAKNDVDKPEENPSIRKTDIVESGVENAAVVPIVFRDPVQLMEELEKRKKSQRRRLIKSLEFPTKKKRREKKRSKKNKHRNEEGKLKE